MNKILLSVSVISIFLVPTRVFAAESKSSVSTYVETNSTTGNQQSKTQIRIEENGNVKTYSSDNPNQNITLESENGSAKASVYTNVGTDSSAANEENNQETKQEDNRDKNKMAIEEKLRKEKSEIEKKLNDKAKEREKERKTRRNNFFKFLEEKFPFLTNFFNKFHF